MRVKTLITILCLCVFLFSFSNKKETTQISNDNSNIVKSLVQTTDYLKLQVNSPMKLAEYTANKNDNGSLIKSISKDIIFIPNKGQIIDTEGKLRPDILYKAELKGVDLYLTNKGMSFVFYKYEDASKNLAAGIKKKDKPHHPFREDVKNKTVKMYRMDLDIVGMNSNVRTLNEEQTVEYFNYYYAHCPDGITNVHGYRKVIFENVYDNIDLVYYSNEKGLKYDFIVKPGGDVAEIKLKYKNEDMVYITEEGKIRALNPFGELETDVLLTYQSDGKLIESNYVKESDGTISIKTNEHDKTKDLIIDPYIGATYYGSSGVDYGSEVTTNRNDDILVTGFTYSSSFPLLNPGGGVYYQSTYAGNREAFILKYNLTGIRQWATYYGGSDYDGGSSINADSNNNIFVSGSTYSVDFPIQDPGGGVFFQGTYGGGYGDVFILKFNVNGIRLWATYYGGDSSDYGGSITINANNNIYITGSTQSTNFPIQNSGSGAYYQGTYGGNIDAFILMFNSSGVRQWATYYGGNDLDQSGSITIDDNSNVYVTGDTWSTNFPIQNPGGGTFFQGTFAGGDVYGDVFIIKFSANSVRQWATYYGGISGETGRSIITDNINNIYITGETWSTDFPVQNPGGGAFFQNSLGGTNDRDAFVLKFNSGGIRQWSTYYGGNIGDGGYSITLDENNNIFVIGYTGSPNFPLQDPGSGAYYQGTYGGGWTDAFILKFNSSSIRQWATYYGGNNWDVGSSITTGGCSNILGTGYTESTNFPVYDPGGGAYYQGSNAGGDDVFILGFDSSGVISNVQNVGTSIPSDYELYQNYPNPFNPITKIRFDLHKSSYTKLIVYDILGKEITTIVNEKLSAGSYEVNWDASSYPSGVYFYKLITDDFVDVKKMLLIK